MNDEATILQIMPASGWTATFLEDGDLLTEPVVCFALVEGIDAGQRYRNVRAMIATDGDIQFCDEVSNFDGLIREN